MGISEPDLEEMDMHMEVEAEELDELQHESARIVGAIDRRASKVDPRRAQLGKLHHPISYRADDLVRSLADAQLNSQTGGRDVSSIPTRSPILIPTTISLTSSTSRGRTTILHLIIPSLQDQDRDHRGREGRPRGLTRPNHICL